MQGRSCAGPQKMFDIFPYIRTAGARMAKYEVDRTAYNDGKNPDNDIVLFRYADVLLMRAEAKVRNGESGQADLDAIRQRVGMPSRPATLSNILAERRMELMGGLAPQRPHPLRPLHRCLRPAPAARRRGQGSLHHRLPHSLPSATDQHQPEAKYGLLRRQLLVR